MEDVFRKLKFKHPGVIINSPTNLLAAFKKLGNKLTFDKNFKSNNTLVFVNDSKSLHAFLSTQLVNIEQDSIFWIAYPKGTSLVETDINRDIIRNSVEKYGIQTVSAISIDETWSALRFRPIDKVGK